MTVADLQERTTHLRREIVSAKLNAAAGHVKDTSQFGKLRRSLARALTHLHQKQREGR